MKKTPRPLFSVITPVYNRRYLLRLAIESVLAQNFTDFELIIVDDGSTDGMNQTIKDYPDTRLTYIYQQNRGPSSARNTGIKIAKGKFICFLDSDDRFRRDKLEKTLSYIKKYPQYKIFHTEEIWYKNNKYLSQKKIHKKPSGLVFMNAVKICCVSLSTACIKREVFSKIGFFDENFPVCEDYEFWLRAALSYKIKLIPEFLTIKEGGHQDQQSSKKGLDKYRFLALEKLYLSRPIPRKYTAAIRENITNKARVYIQGAEKRGKLEEAALIKAKLTKILKKVNNES
jgi:glycosyltransferase involved in cell wall biosynthesis